MLRITGEPTEELRHSFCYQTSQWINVAGNKEKSKNHFVRTQGERVLQLLEVAFEQNAKKTDPISREAGPDLFIISPFHTVAEGMRQLLSTSLSGDYPVLDWQQTAISSKTGSLTSKIPILELFTLSREERQMKLSFCSDVMSTPDDLPIG